MFDYIIVGDGIAALFLYYFLSKKGKRVRIIGNQDALAASTASTGIINPITGRRYAMTWMAEDLLTFAESFYTTLEEELKLSFFHQRNIYREFEDVRSQNNWMNRTAEASYEGYYNPQAEKLDPSIFIGSKSGMEICRSFWVNAKFLVEAYRRILREEDVLLNDSFLHDDLKIESDSVSCKDVKAEKIIFAEGFGVNKNPWFKDLPFRYALGHTLLIEAEIPDLERIVKKKLFFIPLGEKRYQIGSSFVRDQLTITEDDKTLNKFKDKVATILNVPYKIISHAVGVRTTVSDHRPILGASPEEDRLILFNGLGTKGYSLAPYFASHLAEHLCEGKKIMGEVGIRRFDS